MIGRSLSLGWVRICDMGGNPIRVGGDWRAQPDQSGFERD